MSQVKLTKVDPAEIVVLQHQVVKYVQTHFRMIKNNDDSGKYSFMIVQDITAKLWKFFRNKIENKKLCSFSLSISEAVIVMLACSRVEDHEPYAGMVTEKYKTILDQQLQSFHIIVEDNNLEILPAHEKL